MNNTSTITLDEETANQFKVFLKNSNKTHYKWQQRGVVAKECVTGGLKGMLIGLVVAGGFISTIGVGIALATAANAMGLM